MSQHFPRYVMIQTVSLCNAKCIFCPYPDVSNELPQGKMSWELFKKIVDECSQYEGIQRVMPYLMNEPLLDKDITKRINYIKEKNPAFSVHLLTNGILLAKEMADLLLDSKLDWLGISVHGIRKETYERTMGLPFDLALKRICNFIERAKLFGKDIENYIMITFLRHKYLSLDEKEETFCFWQDMGIKRISYFERPISRAGNVRNLPQVRHTGTGGCNSIWTNEMIHILYNGDVILCCMDWRREVILGNLNRQSIYEIWNGARKRIWEMVCGKRESPEDFICKRCEESIQTCEEKSQREVEYGRTERC